MKAKFKAITAVISAVTCALSFTACSGDVVGESTLLGEPKAVERIESSALATEDYQAFKSSVEAFAADFAAQAYADYKKRDNFAVSPISVYTALALAAECANGETREEILGALGVTHEQLKTQFPTLYRSLEVEHKPAHPVGDGISGRLDLTNSIWVNEGTEVKQPCIDSLSNNYYAYSYSADFKNSNAEANKAVRDFVSKQTKGLIDKDFELSTETLFTLINTLYLKTVWFDDGRDLAFTRESYDFTAKDGSVKKTQLLLGQFYSGRTAEFDTFTSFYTQTYDGYEIKFILPKDGYTVDQAFTAENIAAVNSLTDYNAYDNSGRKHYTTRVLFPEYKCKYDGNIIGTLKDKFGIDSLFNPSACDFSTLTDKSCYCGKIRHVTDLTVDRKGIEGAAVTVELWAGSPPSPFEIVREEFIIDRAFGFIITDEYDTTLFSGVVNNI